MTTPTIKLSSGHQMPLVGFGCVARLILNTLRANILMFARLWKVNNHTCADQVYNSIKSGYRLFDGACGLSKLRISLMPNSPASLD